MSSQNSNLKCVVHANGIFTKKLYNILSKSSGNVFFSPISIHSILSLAAQGSDGITKKSLQNALSVPSVEVLAKGYKDVMSNLNEVKDVALYMANKVYIKESYELKEAFKTAVTTYFYSEIQPVNFSQSSVAAQTINNWVENKTNHKIKDLVSPGSLNDDTRLVLVNAIYFKGNWAQQFDPNLTHTEKFYISAYDSIDVQMMHLEAEFYYKEDKNLDAQILELPYTNKNVSMVIILPRKKTGISELEQKLAGVDLTKITEDMYRPDVVVSLPKFKIETTMELNDPLIQLGLSSMFDETADFSGMLNSNEPLCVSKVIQKAFIEVNEEGAEAAAATVVQMVAYCSLVIPSPPVVFTVDHPFMCIIKHSTESQDEIFYNVLFCGTIHHI